MIKQLLPMTLPAGHMFAGLFLGGYNLILADPAWSYRNWSAKGEKKNPNQHYDCMTDAEIKAMPVGDLAADDCYLVLWATAPKLPEQLATMAAWGFEFKTSGAWAKRSPRDRAWQFGPGYILRSAAEFILIGTRGTPVRRNKNIRNLIVAPVREHSRKPDEIYGFCKALTLGPYLELNARAPDDPDGAWKPPGPDWTGWGDEMRKRKK